MNSIIETSKNDWKKFLKEINFTIKDVDNYLKNMLDTPAFNTIAGEVTDVDSDLYIRKKSNIHGFGIFAKKDISKDDNIGIAVGYNDGKKYRSYIGRYSNHSCDNNAILQKVNSNIITVCIKDIHKNEEILLDYRDHWGSF
tara:strand:+ start:7361 stop:7783 length:423 start_codon:yes stop_codon:yes gene_type:complete